MRVLVVSQYYAPEVTAAAARVHAFATGLASLGHTVRVICEIPNHPTGVVLPGYGARAFDTRLRDGLKVTYVWVSTSTVKTFRSRLLAYGSFAAMACAAGASWRPDVVFASSPPLPVGVAGRALAGLRRAPWVLDVRDLWPEAAIAVGELRGGAATRAATAVAHGLYRSAAAITTPSERSRDHIASGGVPREKIHYVPSGTTRDWLDLGSVEVDRGALGLSRDEFVWTYAGNVGLAQGLETAIEAAGALGSGYRLLVVGDGPELARLREHAARVAPTDVDFTGLVARQEAGRYMRASDALLVSLANTPGLAYAVPSKLYDCCAVGRPVIVAATGEARRLASEHHFALGVEPGDSAGLAEAIRRLRTDRPLRDRLTGAARVFAEQHLRERQIARLEALLASVR
jgi:glycosyltransferase involved in cell wall biosynthesis